jgi:hypothetical protein
VEPNNAIKEELSSFISSIEENREPKVSAGDGLRALDVAYKIIDRLAMMPNLMS